MKRPTSLLTALFLLLVSTTAWSQQLNKRITNQDVIDMAGLGLSDDVIMAKIRGSSAGGTLQFDTSVDGLKGLKAGKVSDEVIKVMINPAPPAAPVVVAATPISNDPNLPPPEVGVYWKNGNAFVFVEGQAISQAKVGGKAGSMFTYGMRNEHWDAFLNGPRSKNIINESQPVFYLYVPDGTSASDYVLISLEKKGDRREFQIGSFGGMTGGKSGVKRDKEVAFTVEHAGIRTYKIKPNVPMKPGEYAFFMGTGQQATMAGGSSGGARSGGAAAGRVYDFRIPE
jgi:hypothetical protein